MIPTVMLHGAIGASDQLEPLAKLFSDNRTVYTLSFSGHGGNAFPEPFSIRQFAADVLRFMEEQGIAQADLFGYSMGGYVALYLALHHPERVGKIATLATKFHWNEATAKKESGMLVPETIEQKLPQFAATLARRHAPNDWKEVLHKTAAMLHEMGRDNPLKPEDYKRVQHEVLVMLGDRDKMVSLEETLAVYRALPQAQMAMVPKTPHPIEMVNQEATAFLVNQFLSN